MAAHAGQSLPLILAREFASKLATPLALIDATGRLLYFNEPAERIIGSTPAEPDGRPAGIDEMATVIARRERRPAHQRLVITTLDGLRRPLAVTAIPLLEGELELLVGCVVLFWEE